MCPTCGTTLPYKSRRRYCSHACANRARAKRTALDVYQALRLLDGTRTLDGVACAMGVSRSLLIEVLAAHRVVRVSGAPHRPGRYAMVHWRNPRQLSLF